jgi:hypothetical protein
MQEDNLIIMRRSWKPSFAGFQVRNITQAQPKAKNKFVVPIYKLTPAQMKEKRDKGAWL